MNECRFWSTLTSGFGACWGGAVSVCLFLWIYVTLIVCLWLNEWRWRLFRLFVVMIVRVEKCKLQTVSITYTIRWCYIEAYSSLLSRHKEIYLLDNQIEHTKPSFGNNPIVLKQTTPVRLFRISRVGILLLWIQTEKHLQRRSLQQEIVRLKLEELKNGVYKAASKRETLKCTTQLLRRHVNLWWFSRVHHVPQTTHQYVHLRVVK